MAKILRKPTLTKHRASYRFYQDDAGIWHEYEKDLIELYGKNIGSITYTSRSDQKETTFKIERKGLATGSHGKAGFWNRLLQSLDLTVAYRQGNFRMRIKEMEALKKEERE